MIQEAGLVVAHDEIEGFERLIISAPTFAHRARPGHFVALRRDVQIHDPLLRIPLAIAEAEAERGTIVAVRRMDDRPALRVGDSIDLLGPLGSGWTLSDQMRNLLLIGTTEHVGALLFLARSATKRACNVTLLIGDHDAGTPLPATMLPATVEYEFARGPDAATAVLELVQPALMRWADALFTTLPVDAYSALAARIQATRLRWERGFAQGILLPPMACYLGICDSCLVPEARRPWRACVDGPQCDVRDFVRV